MTIRPTAAVLLTSVVAVSTLLAACSLEPAATRRGTRAELGLGDPASASVRVAGDPALDGAAAVQCGPIGAGEERFEVRLAPAAAAGTRIEMVVPGFHGAGVYQGELSVRRLNPGGAFITSAGVGELGLADAADAAGVDAYSGSLRGRFEGDAGSGELEAEFENCYFFK